MRYIFAIFLIFDVIYQTHIDASQPFGWVYYDLLHYGVVFCISMYYLLKKGDIVFCIFSVYLGYCLVNILMQLGLDKESYLQNVQLDYSSFTYIAIILILTFIAYKRWVR